MREGSYAQIERGMRVIDRKGETLGTVDTVIYDEASGIFHGVAVHPSLFTHPLLVPAGDVVRVHDETLFVDAVLEELAPYEMPSERYHEIERRYEEAHPE